MGDEEMVVSSLGGCVIGGVDRVRADAGQAGLGKGDESSSWGEEMVGMPEESEEFDFLPEKRRVRDGRFILIARGDADLGDDGSVIGDGGLGKDREGKLFLGDIGVTAFGGLVIGKAMLPLGVLAIYKGASDDVEI
jgi:hypothetical protein